MNFPIEKVLEYGLTGVALAMLFYLNVTWQNTVNELNAKWEKIILSFKESIDSCPGNRQNKIFRG